MPFSTPIPRDAYVDALRSLDPGRPATVVEVVPRTGWDRFHEIVLQLQARTLFRYVLHGSVGVGKSTELDRWRRQLTEQGVKVRYVVAPSDARAVVTLLEELRQHKGILLIDGLDLHPEDAQDWFGPATPLVDPRLPALVAVCPHSVGRWPPDRRDPKLTLVHLPPFPVIARDARVSWEGVRGMVPVLERRAAQGLLERPELAKRVVLMSGGVPRDAVRILRSAVLSAARRQTLVGLADVVAGERELRQDFEQAFHETDFETLGAVFDRRRYLDADPRLLTMGAVLTYEDQEGTYSLPHPVLWSAIGRDHGLAVEAAVAGNVP